MKFLILALALLITQPLEAKEKNRQPNALSAGEKRIVTFHCVHEESGLIDALGIVTLTEPMRKSIGGTIDLKLHLRDMKSKGNLQTRILTGQFTSVPEGYVLRTDWNGTFGSHVLLHLHPEEKTIFPKISGKSQCAIDHEMNNLED